MDRIKKINYCYVTVPSRAGNGAKVLTELKEAGVNLIAFTGFPTKGGKAQLDMVSEDMGAIRRLAKKNGWRLSKMKKGFHVTGTDDLGAMHKHINKLANEKISVTAADAVAAGKGRYGMVLWVKPKDYPKAARVLKAK